MKFLLLTLAIICSQFSFSQSIPNFNEFPLEKTTDYKPAEIAVLSATKYLFTTAEKEDPNRPGCLRFVIKWMTGTPDYGFDLDGSLNKLFKGNDPLLGLYMAAMAKFSLENPSLSKDKNLVNEGSLNTVIDYCEKNNIKMTKGLRKYAEDRKKI